MKHAPPSFGRWLFERLLPIDDQMAVLGDLHEEFHERAETHGVRQARRWYRRQVLRSLPRFIEQALVWGFIMLRNYLTIALRTLRKHKGYSFINIFGLAIGVTCFTLIVLYVQDERSYDRFHTNADRIYRVVEIIEGSEESASNPVPVGETLEADFPHLVEHAVRFFNLQAPTLTLEYAAEDGEVTRFNEPRFFFADAAVFDVFTYPLVQGSASTALVEPNTVVLTQRTAQRYFGSDNPIGKTLRFENEHDLTVTGVMADVPENTHLPFDFLASFETLDNLYTGERRPIDSWYWNPAWTYVMLADNAMPETLEAQFPGFVQQYFPEVIKPVTRLYLQPLTDIHLHSSLDYEVQANSDVAYVYIFSAIAIFILLIACINFTNLASARSVKRAREVGMRKALGAHRQQLIGQFLGEAILTSALAVLVALPLVWALLPALNALAGKALAFNPLQNPLLLAVLVAVPLVTGTLAGLYPAVVLSGYKPALVLKGTVQVRQVSVATLLRKGLVVTQFAISIVLMVATFAIYSQISYLQEARLGFDREAVLYVSAFRTPILDQYDAFKDELLDHASIQAVTVAEDVVGKKYQTGNFQVEGSADPVQQNRLMVHNDFAATLGIEMAAGRGYSDDFPTDGTDAIVINEAMVRSLGWGTPEEALGRQINGRAVIGVTEDFHYASLHESIGPFVMDRLRDDPGAFQFFGRYIAVRIGSGQVREAVSFIEDTWAARVPERPLDYFFLDDDLEAMYRAETTLGTVASVFAGLAVLVACLGLFGLASYMAEQRTKEIGIRKVLGAPVSQLVGLLSKEFVLLVSIAVVVAWPVAYCALDQWMSGFAYQTNLGAGPFVLAGLLAFAIALSTISYQAIRTALSDPIQALRYE
ncbi:MAG: ABC transporter permease [Bacteroidota bacterium]